MTMANRENKAAALAVARKSLDGACNDLDDAVRSLPEMFSDDKVMATPGLIALLLRVVVARRELNGLEPGSVADHTRRDRAPMPQ